MQMKRLQEKRRKQSFWEYELHMRDLEVAKDKFLEWLMKG
jgi:hypothetical protein